MPIDYDALASQFGGSEAAPDFSDVRAGGSTNAREREAQRQHFAGGGYYSIPPVQLEHFDPATPEGSLNLSMAMGAATGGVGTAVPALGRFLARPAVGGVTGGITGALPGLRRGDPLMALQGGAFGAASGAAGSTGLGAFGRFLLRLKSAAPAATTATQAAAPSVPAFAVGTGATAPQAIIPNVTFSAPAAAAARIPSSVVPFAAPAAAAPIAAAAPRVAAPVVTGAAAPALEQSGFQAGSAELAKMLGTQAPVRAIPPTATVAEMSELPAEAIANQLRKVAEQSKVNKLAVMKMIKEDYAKLGFPTWKAMSDFVFKPRTTLPSTYTP